MAQHKTEVMRFLNELSSNDVKGVFEFLNVILEKLEEKIDPEPLEMEIVDSAYQVLEKMNILKNNLRQYVIEDNETLPGNKLFDLYRSGTIRNHF